jgi:hypothetical protein
MKTRRIIIEFLGTKGWEVWKEIETTDESAHTDLADEFGKIFKEGYDVRWTNEHIKSDELVATTSQSTVNN